MTNAERILTEVDRRLDHEVDLTLFGRAALALGFPNPPREAETSMDVDAIIPAAQAPLLENDWQFWAALEEANKFLEPEGLYITHLFEEGQIAIARGWIERRRKVERPALRNLRLYRPAAADLILTKMMRGADAEDWKDIQFLLAQPEISRSGLQAALESAALPEGEELKQLFAQARERLLAALEQAEKHRPEPGSGAGGDR